MYNYVINFVVFAEVITCITNYDKKHLTGRPVEAGEGVLS